MQITGDKCVRDVQVCSSSRATWHVHGLAPAECSVLCGRISVYVVVYMCMWSYICVTDRISEYAVVYLCMKSYICVCGSHGRSLATTLAYRPGGFAPDSPFR